MTGLKVLMLVIGGCLLLCAGAFAEDFKASDFSQAREYPLADGRILLYEADEQTLAMRDQDGCFKMVSTYCSYPAVTPDQMRFAYLEPWGWEEFSGIFLFDPDRRQKHPIEISEILPQYTAKEIVWLDDRILLVIAGYWHGTVTAGGQLYYYDRETQTSALIVGLQNAEIARINLNGEAAVLSIVGGEYDFGLLNFGTMVRNNRFTSTIVRDQYTTEIALTDLRRLITDQTVYTIPERPEIQVLVQMNAIAYWLNQQIIQMVRTAR